MTDGPAGGRRRPPSSRRARARRAGSRRAGPRPRPPDHPVPLAGGGSRAPSSRAPRAAGVAGRPAPRRAVGRPARRPRPAAGRPDPRQAGVRPRVGGRPQGPGRLRPLGRAGRRRGRGAHHAGVLRRRQARRAHRLHRLGGPAAPARAHRRTPSQRGARPRHGHPHRRPGPARAVVEEGPAQLARRSRARATPTAEEPPGSADLRALPPYRDLTAPLYVASRAPAATLRGHVSPQIPPYAGVPAWIPAF